MSGRRHARLLVGVSRTGLKEQLIIDQLERVPNGRGDEVRPASTNVSDCMRTISITSCLAATGIGFWRSDVRTDGFEEARHGGKCPIRPQMAPHKSQTPLYQGGSA